jgi:hypothetical protein
MFRPYSMAISRAYIAQNVKVYLKYKIKSYNITLVCFVLPEDGHERW